ncbi:PTS system mannose/fructose/sorbose family transporter subunit IID [Petroclostridium sp. X23]|jgi:D-glucosaminate-specific PTS system IID component|uniref:PTS system mannose/fructose/sorbose family transporter subunit IID n=1 Tax=Petroclostridium sp. X23 TaxID=3045146 RepID=UPI0024ADF607|nr:PTS system mannose/fructose/sorbose family transporter subunit IID [Petroclostridium sp. X23]WHH60518.1 PTS system mannose/fructose/sorbose family transporter subunit IID [Petroclostridium sp. X23]
MEQVLEKEQVVNKDDNSAKGKTVLTKKDVLKAYNRWYWACEVSNSYERMQTLAFCYSISGILAKLYKKREDLVAALQRHLNFFNSQGIWGSTIHGIVIAMEEAKARGEDVPDDTITGIKTGLMGPLAGIGDTMDWGTWKPLIFSLAASLSANGSMTGVFVAFLFALIPYLEGRYLWLTGYNMGRGAVKTILQSGLVNELITGSSILGLFMVGALTANTVKLPLAVKVSMSGEWVPIQGILDSILPGMLPLAAVLGLYWYLRKVGQKFGNIVFIILGVCLLGSLIGLF